MKKRYPKIIDGLMGKHTQFEVDGKTRRELIAQKKTVVLERRKQYEDWWNESVKVNRGKRK